MAVFTKIVIMRVFEELLAFKQLDKKTVKDIIRIFTRFFRHI